MIQRRLLRRVNIEKYNPHHDQRGRFSSGAHGGGGMTLANQRMSDAQEVASAMTVARDLGARNGYPHPDDPRNGDPKYAAECARIDTKYKQIEREGGRTDQLYSDGNGHYNATRTRQQEKLADQILQSFIDKGATTDGQALWMGGLPGSGKTRLAKSPDMTDKLGINTSKYVHHDPDGVKLAMIDAGMLPVKRWKGLKPNEATSMFHSESCVIADMVMHKAMKKGYNILFDGTMKTQESVLTQVKAVQSGPTPYTTKAVFLNTSPAVSFASAKQRHLGGGRYVPYDVLTAAAPHGEVPYPKRTFEALKRGTIDQTAEFVRVAPKLPASMQHGMEPPEMDFMMLNSTVMKRLRKLLRKAMTVPMVTQWILAYRAGRMTWTELLQNISTHTFAMPDMGGRAGYGDELEEEDTSHFLPGTWGEVVGAWSWGYLTTPEYMKLLEAVRVKKTV